MIEKPVVSVETPLTKKNQNRSRDGHFCHSYKNSSLAPSLKALPDFSPLGAAREELRPGQEGAGARIMLSEAGRACASMPAALYPSFGKGASSLRPLVCEVVGPGSCAPKCLTQPFSWAREKGWALLSATALTQ
eukprot:1151444-Pelagomonas_calceolata.AAC.2